MPILTMLAPLIAFFLREVVVKMLLFAALFATMALFVPWIMAQLLPFIGLTDLNAFFATVPAGMWYFWDMANMGYGLPLLISAQVAAFLIRRIPFFG